METGNAFFLHHENDEEEVDKYFVELTQRIIPLLKNSDKNHVVNTLGRVKRAMFFSVAMHNNVFSDAESLSKADDEYRLLQKISKKSHELLDLIQGISNKKQEIPAARNTQRIFTSGLNWLESAKNNPCMSSFSPEDINDDLYRKHMTLEFELERDARGIDQIPNINELTDMLKAMVIASDFITERSLNSCRGRRKSRQDHSLTAAVRELDQCFKEYFSSHIGRTNGTSFQNVAFEILCDNFFGSYKEEQIKRAIKYLPELARR